MAILEASRTRVNIDSPKNMRPIATPYEAAREFAVDPGFHRVRVAELVQAMVGGAHFRGDPGAAAASGRGAARSRA